MVFKHDFHEKCSATVVLSFLNSPWIKKTLYLFDTYRKVTDSGDVTATNEVPRAKIYKMKTLTPKHLRKGPACTGEESKYFQ